MKLRKFWLICVLTCIAVLVLPLFLPHDRYIRYQNLDVGAYAKAKWIYERIVFDPTPIDIAFFGTSHTLNAVDSVIMESELSQLTACPLRVANLALPHLGRDMHKTLIKLLLEHKKPKRIFLEVREMEARRTHPATHFLADASDILDAPILINLDYLSNISKLPLRQAKLYLHSRFPEFFGYSARFDDERYVGPHLNYTLQHGVNGPERNRVATVEELDRAKAEWEKSNELKIRIGGTGLGEFIYRTNRKLLQDVVDIVNASDSALTFLYLPGYEAPSEPYEPAPYAGRAPMLVPAEILAGKDVWSDIGHLNAQGAIQLSNWLAMDAGRQANGAKGGCLTPGLARLAGQE